MARPSLMAAVRGAPPAVRPPRGPRADGAVAGRRLAVEPAVLRLREGAPEKTLEKRVHASATSATQDLVIENVSTTLRLHGGGGPTRKVVKPGGSQHRCG